MICVAQTSLDYSEIRTHTKTEVFHNLLLDRAIAMVGNLGDLKMLLVCVWLQVRHFIQSLLLRWFSSVLKFCFV